MSIFLGDTALVYSDGACSGNPGPGGWGSIICTPDLKVTELGGGEQGTTNNRMEMMAALRALEFLRDFKKPVWVYTDSTYLIRGITQWVYGWQKRDWQNAEGKEVANQDLWQELVAVTRRRTGAAKIDWRYVRGHQGYPGNERVDEIAVGFGQGKWVDLYRGPLKGYGVDILELPPAVPLPEMKNNTGPKAAAFSYLSYVNGVLQRHATWRECEAVVKGRPGAKFKKAMSEADELAIMKEWKVDPSRLKK